MDARLARSRWSKYGAKRSIYGDREYASRLEADYAAQLDLRVRAGDIASWRAQVPVKLEVGGRLVTTYIIDFYITHVDGTHSWVETKGLDTDVWLLKKKLFQALYPNEHYTVVRRENLYGTRGRTTRKRTIRSRPVRRAKQPPTRS